jgi:hypothetical protein
MATNITSYSTIVSAVTDVLEDDSQEFANYIPIAIDLAEQRLLRELDSTGVLAQVTTQTNAGNRLGSKPADYRLAYEVRIKNASNQYITMKKRTRSFIEDYWPFANTSTGFPKYYADWDYDQWIFAPTPDNTYEVHSAIVKKPTRLTAATSTNYFTDNTPDLLFAATMIEMCIFSRNQRYLEIWKAKYAELLQGANNEGRRERKDSNIEVMNPSPRQNNLMQGN